MNEMKLTLKDIGWSDELIDLFVIPSNDISSGTNYAYELNAISYDNSNCIINEISPFNNNHGFISRA